MGRPKPLLQLDGATLLERAIAALAVGGCAPVICVVPAGPAEIGAAARAAGAAIVVNPDADSEQIDSLRLGLDALPAGVDAVVVHLSDHPLASAETVRALVRAREAGGAPIVRPVYGGEPGHPTLFARVLFDELRADQPHGARSVIEAHAHEVEDVPVDDPGIAVDLDTPDDVRRAGGIS